MNSIRTTLFLPLFFFTTVTRAQPEVPVSPDSSEVIVRPFDEAVVEKLKTDPELDYAESPVGLSLWERFRIWLGQLIDRLLKAAVTTDWTRFLIIILVIVGLVYVILRLLHVDALKMFYGTSASTKYSVLEEDIHAMDFEGLLKDALQQNEYRLAVRLLFLHSLKLLSDKHLIHWQPGKTNHDYLNELSVQDLKTGFNELNFYFEYAWYGNFRINAELYSKVNSIFTDWRTRV